MHIFVRTVIAKGSWVCLKILKAYELLNVHPRRPPETRRARWNNAISTTNMFALYHHDHMAVR